MLMKSKFIPFFLSAFLCATFIHAQIDCTDPGTTVKTHHGNEIRSFISNYGLQFDDSLDPGFGLASLDAKTISTDFTYLTGKDDDGNILLANPSYSTSDYAAGILRDATSALCANLRNVWTVSDLEIYALIEDWADNGVIDDPIPEDILTWPALGNSYYPDNFGVSIPSRGLAHFHDQNSDGAYDPYSGDYPILRPGLSIIPAQMSFTVFNGMSSESSYPIPIELSQTMYSFACSDNKPINRTLFAYYEITNLGDYTIDSVVFSKLINFDIGCPSDDYVGSIPDLNAAFAYNAFAQDDTICYGAVFESSPPAQGITILDKPLSSFNYIHPNFYFAITLQEVFNVMHGLDYAGNPILDDMGQATKYYYYGNPNTPSSWSMNNSIIPPGNLFGLVNVSLGNMLPNEKQTLNLAYSYHQYDGLDHLGNVDKLYNEIPLIQDFFDTDFSTCPSLANCIDDDCVWPGDTDNDGKVSHLDILPISYALTKTELARNASISAWTPQSSSDWTTDFYNSTNEKHIDCDGDGSIQGNDFEVVRNFNYGRVNDNFTGSVGYANLGDEIHLDLENTNDDYNFLEAQFKWLLIKMDSSLIPTNCKGWGFVLNYNPEVLKLELPYSSPLLNNDFSIFHHENLGRIEIATADSTLIFKEIIGRIALRANSNLDYNGQDKITTNISFTEIGAIDENGNQLIIGGQNQEICVINPNIGLDIINDNTSLHVFPNPAKDYVSVRLENGQIDKLELYNAKGQLVEQRKQLGTAINLNTTKLNPGVYFFKIYAEEQVSTSRLVILH